MALRLIWDKLMGCFTNGYQALVDLDAKEGQSYCEIKAHLDEASSEWENLEKETSSKIKETVEYFEPFSNNEPGENEVPEIMEKAKLLQGEFQALSERHGQMKGKAVVDPKIVEQRCQYSTKMKNNIVLHGRKAWIAAGPLGMILGGVAAWAKWNGQILPEVLGVLIGGVVLLIIGGLAYFLFTAVAAKWVRKWEDLQKRTSQLQEMGDIIDKKAMVLNPVEMILGMIVSKVQSVKQGSIRLVEQCKKYNDASI